MKSLFYLALCGFVISQFADNSNGFDGFGGPSFPDQDFNGFGPDNGGRNFGADTSMGQQPQPSRGSSALRAVSLGAMDLSRPAVTTSQIDQAPTTVPVLPPSNFNVAPSEANLIAPTPVGNFTSEDSRDKSLDNSNTIPIITIVFSVITAIAIAALAVYFYLRRPLNFPFKLNKSKSFDEENQDHETDIQKQQAFMEDRLKNNASPQASMVESTWSQDSHPVSTKKPTLQIDVPKKTTAVPTLGPSSAASEMSVFGTKDAFTKNNPKNSFFIHSFNSELSIVEEEGDTEDDDDSLFDIKNNEAYPKKSLSKKSTTPGILKGQTSFANLKV